ncbi:hypothetical protein RvY_07330-2 [Ramazzottius varieornatus]|uniref:Uncharacterized protein n=1 Tax=Ramazzottius varieornatus TaxID=947166 RepID=A0A1D1VB81_RAMVA|nr:hypothetical protein RvY_07330-2 [Ramazzottius varieornatus]
MLSSRSLILFKLPRQYRVPPSCLPLLCSWRRQQRWRCPKLYPQWSVRRTVFTPVQQTLRWDTHVTTDTATGLEREMIPATVVASFAIEDDAFSRPVPQTVRRPPMAD